MVNTVDPARARHDRLERWRGHPGVLAAAVAASAATLVCGFLAGNGLGEFVEQFRTMAVDSVFDDRGDDAPPYGVMWGTFGLFGLLLAVTLTGAAVRRYQGRPTGPAFPAVAALAACTAGTGVSARGWLPPLAVGTAVDPVFHHDETWGFGAWLMYYADRWVPALLLAVTVLALVNAIQVARRYAEVARTRERLLAHGRRVPADVVEVKLHLGGDESGTRVVGATVTVSFSDLAGVRHWVTRKTRDTTVTTGAEVLFDPARPDDEKSVFVALRRHPALSDWLPAD